MPSAASNPTPSRHWYPRQWAQAMLRLPPECRALAVRRVPPEWRQLVAYMVWIYVPALARLRREMESRGHA